MYASSEVKTHRERPADQVQTTKVAASHFVRCCNDMSSGSAVFLGISAWICPSWVEDWFVF